MAENCNTNLEGEKGWQAGSSAMPSDGVGHGRRASLPMTF